GPSTTCHSTRFPGSASRTFMSKPPALKRNCSTPPTLPSPCVSVVHQPDRPSRVVSALYASSRDDDLIPTLCKMSTIYDASFSGWQLYHYGYLQTMWLINSTLSSNESDGAGELRYFGGTDRASLCGIV